ncbi:MAG: hypothetical protein WDN75_20715 [Bacteroidota bacterium]
MNGASDNPNDFDVWHVDTWSVTVTEYVPAFNALNTVVTGAFWSAADGIAVGPKAK